MKKRKVLALLDSPTVSTGFASVARNILKQINDTGLYDVTVIGINHYGDWYDQEKHPFKIYPAMPYGYTDMFGRGLAFQILQGSHKTIRPPFDLFFTIQDHFILYGDDTSSRGFNLSTRIKALQLAILENGKVSLDNLFNWIGYFPVDGTLRKEWVQEGIAMADYPVSYTRYGAVEMLRHDSKDVRLEERLNIIPHGVNLKEFYPLEKKEIKKFRKKFFGGHVKDDTFLIVNVSRNQPRKDLSRTMKIFAEYKKINPKAFLYLHAKPQDIGGDLWHIAKQLGIEEGKDMACPSAAFNEMFGVPIETLNKIYNSADVLLTTTLGEGWGFINTEAMAVRKPILAPANTSIPEIFNMENIHDNQPDIEYMEKNYETLRGIPIKCGTGNDWITYGGSDNSVIRPLTNVRDGVKKLDWVYNNKDKVQKIVDNGYKYATELSWDNVCKSWVKLFDDAYNNVVEARAKGHIKSSKNNKDG